VILISTNCTITVTLKLSKYDVKGHSQVRQRSISFKLRQQSAPHDTDAPNVEEPIATEIVGSAIAQAKAQVDQFQSPSPSWDVLLGRVNWFMTLVGPIAGVNIYQDISNISTHSCWLAASLCKDGMGYPICCTQGCVDLSYLSLHWY
jgi:hypothetical protein